MAEQIEGQKQLDPKLLTSLAPELARGNFWSGTSRHRDRLISITSVFLGSVVAELGYAQISVPTHTMTYGADTLYKFDPYRLSHYRLFNVTGMILPLHTIVIPKFVQKVYSSGEVASFRAPGIGYWDVVGISSEIGRASCRERV